jgi:hypothetical protein
MKFMKIRPVGAELFHADRQTDMTKLIVSLSSFSNAPIKKVNGLTLIKEIHCVLWNQHFYYPLSKILSLRYSEP